MRKPCAVMQRLSSTESLPKGATRANACGRIISGLLCTLALFAYVASAQSVSPLGIETALSQPAFLPFAPIAISPNGEWVAYTLQYPNRMGRSMGSIGYTSRGLSRAVTGSRVWMTEIKTGRTLPVAESTTTSWAPSWSPNGQLLAFYSDADGIARVWVRDMARSTSRRVSDAIVRSYIATQVPRWSPDSRKLLTPIIPYGSALPEAQTAKRLESRSVDTSATDHASSVTVLRVDPRHLFGEDQAAPAKGADTRAHLVADLALIDITSNAVQTLATSVRPWDYSISADGAYAAFSSLRTLGYTSLLDLEVVSLKEPTPSAPHVVAANIAISNYATSRSLSWAPAGGRLLYATIDSVNREQYFTMNAPNWQPHPVGMMGVTTLGQERRSVNGQSLWWNADGRSFYVVERTRIVEVSILDGTTRNVVMAPPAEAIITLVGDQRHGTARQTDGGDLLVMFSNDSTKRAGFALADVRTGRWSTLREEDRFYGDRRLQSIDVADEGQVVFLSENVKEPTEIWASGSHLNDFRRITHSAPQVNGLQYGESRLIEWSTADGKQCQGALLLPAEYRPGSRYPLVVYPYPNDHRSDKINRFGLTGTGVENMQLLATRGFAVLAPDVSIDLSNELQDLAAAILPGIDRTIALGIVDSTRIGLIGHSWGGYTVLALLTQSTRFRAAVMRGGHGDLVAALGILEPSGHAFGLLREEGRMKGTIWNARSRYIANSPIYELDRVHTPLLIIHGEEDTTIPVFLADQIFASLQRLGQNVEYARYGGENHTEARWAHENQRDYLKRMIGWFQTYLKGDSGDDR